MSKIQDKKQKTNYEKLTDTYRLWEQFTAKSKIRMRTKLNKNKKEYYDFDYTRGQYFYSYPENHINFATPQIQKKFINDLLQKQTQDISKQFLRYDQDNCVLQDEIRPYELHQFLRDIHKKLHEQIAMLRIQKSLFIHQYLNQKNTIDLMESQIRSYFYRYTRLHDIFFLFEKSLAQRLEDRASTLKMKKFDEFHFSQVEKGDIVIYLRMQGVKQRINFNLERLTNQLNLDIQMKRHEIEYRCFQRRGQQIKKLQIEHGSRYIVRKDKLQKYFTENESNFFQNEGNIQQLQDFLCGLNYMKQTIQSKQCFFNINNTYQEVSYVPAKEEEMRQMLYSICSQYFPLEMIINLYTYKRQHLCYRLNYFGSIILRTLSQTHNYVTQIKEKDLNMYRNSMKRQLETVFSNQIDRLFNISQHQIIGLVDEGSYSIPEFKFKAFTEKQNIFKQYFKNNHLMDPFTKSIINMLDVYSDEILKQVIDNYANQIIKIAPNKLKNLSLYYCNCRTDQKSHIINLLNKKLIFGGFNQNLMTDKFTKVLTQDDKMDLNLLKTIYMLYAINNIQKKKQIESVINAQISIMYKIKFRIQLLRYKNNLPFQMSPEFLNRFTQTNDQANPFQFLSTKEKNKQEKYPDPQNYDKIFRTKIDKFTQKIEVRRMMPQNALFQGKNTLYKLSLQQIDQLMQKLHNICAFMVERRQNYQQEQTFTGIIDRFQLINHLLRLQSNYQNAKLDYMQQLISVFQETINPEGITRIVQQITNTKGKQCYYNLNQAHFEEDYFTETQIWHSKAQILKIVIQKQRKQQKEQKEIFKADIMKHNHLNNVPQISSLYYCDELSMEVQDDNIVEEVDESMSDMSESQFVLNNSKFKSDNRSEFSAISSEYHVKTTFKQILGRNSVPTQAAEQNKRQQLMSKKKKRLINDSILGGILSFQKCHYYHYIHRAIDFMQSLQTTFANIFDTDDCGIRKEFYAQILVLIKKSDDSTIRDKQLIQQTMLHKVLKDSNSAISKVIERLKFNPSQIEDYLFLNSQIYKNLTTNTTGSQINDIRGLYTCLNLMKLSQMHYKYYLLDKAEQSVLSTNLQKVLKRYSSEDFPKQGLFLSKNQLIEQARFKNSFHIVQNLIKKSQFNLIFLGNYHQYFKLSILTSHIFKHYYKLSLQYFCSIIYDYQFLKAQLQAIQLYNCSFGKNSSILNIQNIENKIFVKRKIEFLDHYNSKLLNPNLIKEFIQLPRAKIETMHEIQLNQIINQNSLLENEVKFELFLSQVAFLCYEMDVINKQINCNIKQKRQFIKIQQICKILPYIHQYLEIRSIESPILKDTFHDHGQYMSFQKHQYSETKNKMVLQYHRLSFFTLNRKWSSQLIQKIKLLLKQLYKRKFIEFAGKNDQISIQNYYNHLQLRKYQEPYRFSKISALKDNYDFYDYYEKIIKLRVWIEAKIIIFGASLTAVQLLNLRLILENADNNFSAFWKDESNQLVKHADIVKMKLQTVDQMSIIDHYTIKFINHQNIKTKYKQFLEELVDMDFKNQGLQIMNLFYISCKSLFEDQIKNMPNFLQDYCFLEQIKNETSQFIQYAIKSNPKRYYKSSKIINFNLLKSYIWDEQQMVNSQILLSLDERSSFIKQILNSNNANMDEMTNEFNIQVYRRARMKEFQIFLKIDGDNSKNQSDYQIYIKKLQQNLLLGVDRLNKIEKYLSKFGQKLIKKKPELIGIKDQILQKIYQSRYYQQLVTDKLFQIGTKTLTKQIQLNQILYDNYNQKELMRQNKIIKATINKVLVPKIILNPYFESPLILQNYFFAGSLKLCYIDNFLNKLKNRAIMVELAQGGFGFLLKINELDQCVQSLCKGLISFTQKQFNDRFRSFMEAFDELKQKYRKNTVQNKSLKSMVDTCKGQWSKQLKSLLYNKLNSYLVTIHTKEKTYQSVFNIIKSLQIEIAKEISTKYEDRIHSLQAENAFLKEKFVEFKQMTNSSTKMSIQQSKDILYHKFKKQVETILNKPVLNKFQQIGEVRYEEQEQEMSNILLKKLRTQKIFFQLKVASIDLKLKQKVNQINKLREQLVILENNINLEQHKNFKISEEIKLLHEKNIEIECLKKQIKKNQEDQVLKKFKLIKINQNLQGKLNRLEEKTKKEENFLETVNKQEEKNMAVQTIRSEKRQVRPFRIKTQHSVPIQSSNRAEQLPIWKQKWQNSERKYQTLMNRLIQMFETFKISKNMNKVLQNLTQLAEDCKSNKLVTKKY